MYNINCIIIFIYCCVCGGFPMSKLYTFRRGAVVPSYSVARDIPITDIASPNTVELPISAEHEKFTVLVNGGDAVLCGQLIAEGRDGQTFVYSSVSGSVKAFSSRKDIAGNSFDTIIISNDGKYTPAQTCVPHSKKLSETTPDEIIDKVRHFSIRTDSGEALSDILKRASQNTRRFILITASDGAYSTINYRLSIDKANDVINGAKIIMRALGVADTDVFFGEDDTEAANSLAEAAGDSNLFSFRMMKMKYPRTHEKLIVAALTGRELSHPLTALDAGYVIVTPRVCIDVFAAFAKGLPSINCYVGVDGDASTYQRTLCVPLGTSYRRIIDACGGLSDDKTVVCAGGGLIGDVITDMDAPFVMPTAEITISKPISDECGECINCGRCASACPMRLMPMLIMAHSKKGKYAKAKRLGLDECIECGACSFVCPEKLPISFIISESKHVHKDEPSLNEEKMEAEDE